MGKPGILGNAASRLVSAFVQGQNCVLISHFLKVARRTRQPPSLICHRNGSVLSGHKLQLKILLKTKNELQMESRILSSKSSHRDSITVLALPETALNPVNLELSSALVR